MAIRIASGQIQDSAITNDKLQAQSHLRRLTLLEPSTLAQVFFVVLHQAVTMMLPQNRM